MCSLAQSAQGGFLGADNLELDFEGKALDQESKVIGEKWQDSTQASQPQPRELSLPENPGLTPLAARLAPSPGSVLGMCVELSIYGFVIWQNSSPCSGSHSCVWSQLQLALTEKKAKKEEKYEMGSNFTLSFSPTLPIVGSHHCSVDCSELTQAFLRRWKTPRPVSAGGRQSSRS